MHISKLKGKSLKKPWRVPRYVASFIGHEPGIALFIGLYSIDGSRPLTHGEYWKVPAYVEMKAFGIRGFTKEDRRSSVLWFNLTLTEFHAAWKGKLVIEWPGFERSWWRWADRNRMPVFAVHEESALDRAMPPWNEINLTWEELGVLPTQRRSALSQWRGIYYIFDISDGKGYVGSAYGSDNLLGRWRNYSASSHGDNVLLRKRDPRQFRFTILERVSPDLLVEDIIRIERT